VDNEPTERPANAPVGVPAWSWPHRHTDRSAGDQRDRTSAGRGRVRL